MEKSCNYSKPTEQRNSGRKMRVGRENCFSIIRKQKGRDVSPGWSNLGLILFHYIGPCEKPAKPAATKQSRNR